MHTACLMILRCSLFRVREMTAARLSVHTAIASALRSSAAPEGDRQHPEASSSLDSVLLRSSAAPEGDRH